MSLKIYKISQNVNVEYDTYSDAVVVAENEEAAKRIHPSSPNYWKWNDTDNCWQMHGRSSWIETEWATPKDITCTLVAETVSPIYTAGQVVCASYHAG